MMSSTNVPTDSLSGPNTPQLDSQPRRNVGWGFWLKWTLATAIGWVVGSLIYSILIYVLIYALNLIFVFMMVASFGLLAGALFAGIIAAMFGFMQGLVIQQIGVSSRRWISASLTGGIIGGAISAGATFLFPIGMNPVGNIFHSIYSSGFEFATDVLFLTMCGLITGAIIGYRQRRILPDSFRVKLRWTEINALGWAFGCAIIIPASWLLYGKTLYPFFGFLDGDTVISITPIALCGLIGGAITGYPLMRALQQSPIQNLKSEIQNESPSSYVG